MSAPEITATICYDIKELGKQLKQLGMLVVQDQVWNRVTRNREAGRTTRYYVDEFHLLLRGELAAWSVEIWKRFRKWGGVPTGITQNVKDLLASPEIENILENSDYICMLNQAPGDRQILAKKLNISPHQLSYVTQANEGEGLLFYGNVIVPFVDRFPKDTDIFRNLYELTGCTKPTLRLWLNSMEEAEIRRALADLRPGSDYDRLFAAARCRERADWLVGINATQLLSVTYHRTLNTGRVVSPTLALLTQREADIAGFVPESFYTAQLHLGSFSAESKLFSNRAEAEEAVVSAGGKCIVTSISQKEKSEAAPALFDLTMLQREANRALGYTAQQTLDYAQSLYEKRLCTYPRTDSRYLSDGMADGVKSLVLCAAGICGLEPPFAVYAEQVCDSAKVSDHHALVPTMSAEDYELDALPAGERELLRLMAAQVLRAVCAPYRWLETSVELVCGGFTYSVKGKTVLDPGWRVYDSAERRDSSLPELHEGDELPVLSAEVKEGQTSPPAHFTEGTLLKAMENAGETPEEAERKGLGTPATRAGIIEKLVAAGFIERKKAKKNTALIPTQTGAALSAVLPEQLASAELTSEWEQKLIQVERGELSPEAFMSGIEDMVRELCGSYTPKLATPQFPTQGEVIGISGGTAHHRRRHL